MNLESKMEKIVSLAKRRGFIYPGSEIYGGLAGTWDYGPLGSELKFNLKDEWWKWMVRKREDVVGISAAILMNPKVWEASGHLTAGFSDQMSECKICHHRFRTDQLEDIKKCPDCGGKLSSPKKFNLMMKTFIGAVEDSTTTTYLRGEITQGVHVNFKNVLNSSRLKIPFGIAQIGRAFRNEITPGNFTYRSREFEQMELQFYIEPNEKEAKKWFEYWRLRRMDWYKSLGMKEENLRFRQHESDEMSHYAKDAWDIEYNTPFGKWQEMEGIHDRGDWDLSQHAKYSKQDLSYFDEKTKERYIPRVIETSGGVDRATLFFLIDSYTEDGDRVILKLHPKLAPYKVAVFPLLANKPQLIEKAREIYLELKKHFNTVWDDRGNIGKRYYSQDEIGTPYCVTIDFETLEKNDVTVRDRDTGKQKRVKILELISYLKNVIN